MREIQASGGFLSYDEPVAHFGLAEHDHVDEVEVHWSVGPPTHIKTPLQSGYRYIISRQSESPLADNG